MDHLKGYSLLALAEANKLIIRHGSGALEEAMDCARRSKTANDIDRQLLWEQTALEVQLALVGANTVLAAVERPAWVGQ